jgi:predicted RNA-binding protein associated with RNAse of E/G family
MSWPFTVVEDREDLIALYIPKGALYKRFRRLSIAEARERGYSVALDDEVWRRDVLRLMYPGAHHSIWVFWEREGDERRHTAYYVNMEEPFRRTSIGFDTNDHMLDIMVTPDLEWRWKDEDELAERVEQGVFPATSPRSCVPRVSG